MFHMVNEHGNAHRVTESAARRDELLLLGYTEVETSGEEKPKATVSKGKKKDKKED